MNTTAVPQALRDRVIRQAGNRCGYCQSSEAITGIPLEIEHLIPESRGGLTIEENLWLACAPCNAHKASRASGFDPLTGIETSLFNPRTQSWQEHFRWSPDGALMEPLTPTGRATVAVLKLNRPLVVAARRRWVEVGWHPPNA